MTTEAWILRRWKELSPRSANYYEKKTAFTSSLFEAPYYLGRWTMSCGHYWNKASGKKEGKDFGICMNPEFMRESTAIHDFYHPPFTIIGTRNDRAAERVAAIYSSVTAPVERTSILVAELIKYRIQRISRH